MGYRNTMFSKENEKELEELRTENAEMETILEITSNLLNAHKDLLEELCTLIPGLLKMNAKVECIFENIVETTVKMDKLLK